MVEFAWKKFNQILMIVKGRLVYYVREMSSTTNFQIILAQMLFLMPILKL